MTYCTQNQVTCFTSAHCLTTRTQLHQLLHLNGSQERIKLLQQSTSPPRGDSWVTQMRLWWPSHGGINPSPVMEEMPLPSGIFWGRFGGYSWHSQHRTRAPQANPLWTLNQWIKETETRMNQAALSTATIGMKKRTRTGFWNIWTMLEPSRLSQVLREMANYKLDLLGLSETRWNGSGEFITALGELLLYSGHANEEKHEYGVGLIITKDLWKSPIEWTAISERLITARLMTRLCKLTIVQCYAPMNEATTEEEEAFYVLLEATLHQIRQSDIINLMGDLNAKIGNVNFGLKDVMGRHGLGTRNENGDMFIDLCVNCNLVISGSLFLHKNIHKITWVVQNQCTFNQIDHFAISKKWKRSLFDVRSYRGAM